MRMLTAVPANATAIIEPENLSRIMASLACECAQPRDSHEIPRRTANLPIAYGAIQVAFRAGENPAGISAISFMVLMSTTETLLVCSLAT